MGLGCPVFDDRGRAVGLLVLRRVAGASFEPHGLRDVFDAMEGVVLPAADLEEATAQAKAARAAAPKEAAPSPAAE